MQKAIKYLLILVLGLFIGRTVVRIEYLKSIENIKTQAYLQALKDLIESRCE